MTKDRIASTALAAATILLAVTAVAIAASDTYPAPPRAEDLPKVSAVVRSPGPAAGTVVVRPGATPLVKVADTGSSTPNPAAPDPGTSSRPAGSKPTAKKSTTGAGSSVGTARGAADKDPDRDGDDDREIYASPVRESDEDETPESDSRSRPHSEPEDRGESD